MTNKIKNLVVNVNETIGEDLIYKGFNKKVYKYENNQITDEVIGFTIDVLSTSTFEIYTIKILNVELLGIEKKSDILFGKKVIFDNLTFKPYINKNFINWSISADSVNFVKNDE